MAARATAYTLLDVTELTVAVGVLATLAGIAVGMQAVAPSPQQPPNRGGADVVSLAAQFAGRSACTLDRPTQRVAGRAATVGGNHSVERFEQARLSKGVRLATGTGTAWPLDGERVWSIQFGEALSDGAIRHAGAESHGCNAASAQGSGLHSRPASSSTLVEVIGQLNKLLTKGSHDSRVLHPGQTHYRLSKLLSLF